jgi:hypothetical protein
MAKTYTCRTHGTEQDSWCPACVHDFTHRRHPNDMTGDERAAELDRLCHQVTIPVSDLRTRIDELVGRPVFTHEIGLAFDALRDEARTRDHPSPRDVMDLIPSEKRIIVRMDD